eukprot:CAMPEP_0180300904 /NCGR_PEP_ID=MMETSP0988-20121125/23093_1 /TAXON_ID=697907 /ORGANISM="non described non described, Strain CCMP2293" /LENGTH=262 /DNA_ID=CAMNT_0022281205 /DNA_START=188 /DNA_END=979 /DNA_ORIENTATION=+
MTQYSAALALATTRCGKLAAASVRHGAGYAVAGPLCTSARSALRTPAHRVAPSVPRAAVEARPLLNGTDRATAQIPFDCHPHPLSRGSLAQGMWMAATATAASRTLGRSTSVKYSGVLARPRTPRRRGALLARRTAKVAAALLEASVLELQRKILIISSERRRSPSLMPFRLLALVQASEGAGDQLEATAVTALSGRSSVLLSSRRRCDAIFRDSRRKTEMSSRAAHISLNVKDPWMRSAGKEPEAGDASDGPSGDARPLEL